MVNLEGIHYGRGWSQHGAVSRASAELSTSCWRFSKRCTFCICAGGGDELSSMSKPECHIVHMLDALRPKNDPPASANVGLSGFDLSPSMAEETWRCRMTKAEAAELQPRSIQQGDPPLCEHLNRIRIQGWERCGGQLSLHYLQSLPFPANATCPSRVTSTLLGLSTLPYTSRLFCSPWRVHHA